MRMSKARRMHLDKQLLSKVPRILEYLCELDATYKNDVFFKMISRKRLRENYFECSDTDLQYLVSQGFLPRQYKIKGYKAFYVRDCIETLKKVHHE